MRFVSWNVNGIRAVSKKEEFWSWFENTDADIINFQEIKMTPDQASLEIPGAFQFWNSADKKG